MRTIRTTLAIALPAALAAGRAAGAPAETTAGGVRREQQRGPEQRPDRSHADSLAGPGPRFAWYPAGPRAALHATILVESTNMVTKA